MPTRSTSSPHAARSPPRNVCWPRPSEARTRRRVERLTAGQAVELLQNLAASRDEELSITIADPDSRIADLAGSARRATAEALKPRSS